MNPVFLAPILENITTDYGQGIYRETIMLSVRFLGTANEFRFHLPD